MQGKNPSDNDRTVRALFIALIEENLRQSIAPGLLRTILEEELWRERLVLETEKTVKFERFIDFVQATPPEGLGADFETLWQLCSGDPLLLDLLDKAVLRERGAPEKAERVDNSSKEDSIHIEKLGRPSGTSRQAGLRKLRKHNPELHAKVVAGDMSINSALLEAGLRSKQITVFVDPRRAAKVIKKAFDEEQLAELIALLMVSLPKDFERIAELLGKFTGNAKQLQELLELLEFLIQRVPDSFFQNHE